MELPTISIPPKVLYHYTSVDSLALILKSHKFRLKSLDQLDDLQEPKSNDKQNYGKFVFVSSWTADKTESIPMWSMYTSKKSGMRIELPTNPFLSYTMTAKEAAEKLSFPVKSGNNGNVEVIAPKEDFLHNEYTLINFQPGKQLIPVEYTNDAGLLSPTVLLKETGNTAIALSEMGKYKNTYWTFKDEWRYRLLFFPIAISGVIKSNNENTQTTGNQEITRVYNLLQSGQAVLPFNYYDLCIRDECYSNMKIVLSSDISESAKIFAELLVKEYNPSAVLMPSELNNLIR